MAHHSMGYKNTTQRDTEPKLATQIIHQREKSLKEEIHFLKHKDFQFENTLYNMLLFNSAKWLI